MYSFREIKPIQNNILLRVKFIVESFYTILGKKMLFGAIWNQNKLLCNVNDRISRIFILPRG